MTAPMQGKNRPNANTTLSTTAPVNSVYAPHFCQHLEPKDEQFVLMTKEWQVPAKGVWESYSLQLPIFTREQDLLQCPFLP